MRHIEDGIQKAIIDASKLIKINRPGSAANGQFIYDYIASVPNGGNRSAREGKRFKEQGVKSGMPDLFLFVPTREFSGLWLEIKRPKTKEHAAGKLSKSQIEVMERLDGVGYCTAVCYSAIEAIDKIEMYLALP